MISLLKNINFGEVARQLSLSVPRHSLPSSSVCPVCQAGKMRFYHDAITNGCTCVCEQCKLLGDLVSLLGAVWKLDALGTCRRIRELRLADISSFEFDSFVSQRAAHQKHVDRGRRMLLAATRPGLMDDGRMPDIIQRLNMRMEVRYSNAKDYCPKIFGCASVEDLLISQSTSDRMRRKKLKKADLSDAGFAVPMFDIPGRPVQFILLTRRLGDTKLTETRVPVGYGKYQEDGVACHPRTMFDNNSCVVLTPSVEVAIRSWSRCSLQHYFDFPLAVAKEYTNSWQLFGNLQKIVWATSPQDTEAISLAARSNANLVISHVRNSSMPEFIRRLDFHKFHRQVQLAKKPWTKAVAGFLQTLSHQDGVAYLQSLCLPDDEVARLRDDEQNTMAGLVRDYFSHKTDHKTTGYKTGVVEQTDRGWFYLCRGRRESICNASVAIASITTYGDREVAHVRVACDDKSFEVHHDYQELRDNFYAVMSKHCLQHGCVLVSPKHWHSRLHSLSLSMNKPQVNKGDHFVGYLPSRRRWVTPSHEIRSGRLTRRTGIPDWLTLPGKLTPTWTGWHKQLDKLHPCLLSASLLVFQQFMSDVTGRPRSPVMFSGTSALTSVGVIKQAFSAASQWDPDNHRWLHIPDSPFSSGRLANRDAIAASYVNAAWLHTTDVQRCYGLFRGAYSLADHGPTYMPTAGSQGVLAALLLYLLKHWRSDGTPVEFVLKHIGQLNSQVNLDKIRSRVVLDVDPALSFVMLLKEIHHSHRPIYGDVVRHKRQAVVRVSDDKSAMFIPSATLEQAVNKLRLGVFENIAILQRLAASRHFRGYMVENNEQGWMIDKAFFDKSIDDDTLKIRNFKLRIVS